MRAASGRDSAEGPWAWTDLSLFGGGASHRHHFRRRESEITRQTVHCQGRPKQHIPLVDSCIVLVLP